VENDFLLSIIKADTLQQDQIEDLKNKAKNISSKKFEKYLITRNMYPFVYQKVQELKLPISLNKNNALYDKFKRNRISILIGEINCLFKENNIPVLFLKGMAYEYLINNKKTHRKTGDIDILVPVKYLKKAVYLLYDKGFNTYCSNAPNIQIEIEDSLKSPTRHVIMSDGQCKIEVHRQFHYYGKHLITDTNESDAYFNSFFKNHVTITNNEIQEIPTLDLCDSMMLICNHAFRAIKLDDIMKSSSYVIKYYIDVRQNAKLIQEQKLWNELYKRADNYNYRLAIGTLLMQINEILNWHSKEATALFVTPEILKYKDHINWGTETLFPIGVWKKPLIDRVFHYTLNDYELSKELLHISHDCKNESIKIVLNNDREKGFEIACEQICKAGAVV